MVFSPLREYKNYTQELNFCSSKVSGGSYIDSTDRGFRYDGLPGLPMSVRFHLSLQYRLLNNTRKFVSKKG